MIIKLNNAPKALADFIERNKLSREERAKYFNRHHDVINTYTRGVAKINDDVVFRLERYLEWEHALKGNTDKLKRKIESRF